MSRNRMGDTFHRELLIHLIFFIAVNPRLITSVQRGMMGKIDTKVWYNKQTGGVTMRSPAASTYGWYVPDSRLLCLSRNLFL